MTLEEIKRTVTMQDVIVKYGLSQNRAGFIRCPFHNEKTASMKIWKDSFRCFGCGKHGDVVDFVAGMDGVSFSEAFASLGGTTGKKTTDLHAFISHRNALKQAKKRKARISAYDAETSRIWAKFSGICETLRSVEDYLNPWRMGPSRPPTNEELIALLMEQKLNAESDELLETINERRAKRVGM